FALHLLLESAESLIDIVVANQYLHVNPVPYLELCLPRQVQEAVKNNCAGHGAQRLENAHSRCAGRSPAPPADTERENMGLHAVRRWPVRAARRRKRNVVPPCFLRFPAPEVAAATIWSSP